MATFDADAYPAAGSNDEFENEDEDMEDVNEGDQDNDGDQGQDDEGGDDDEDDDNDDNDGDEDDDQNEPDSPSRRASHHASAQRSASGERSGANPSVVLTSPSPRHSAARSPLANAVASLYPPTRSEALNAQAYDIVPTMAAPQSTSINALAATPDMRWVFSGGSDGYVRMFNWVDTANGKVPLTVAQKHPFVDSVMKAGSLLTYWENEEAQLRTPPAQNDDGINTSPVYSLAVQHQALWLASGLESGGINLQTCRHQAGTRITTLKGHTSAVSVMSLSQDETSLLSGSWDKNIHDWDLNTGGIKRSFAGIGGQVSAIETRPMSDVPVPEVSNEAAPEPTNGTFSSNNADVPRANGTFSDFPDRQDSGGGDEDAMGSPSGSLFGEGDHGSLFGEDTAGPSGGNAFGEDDDELTRALANGLNETDEADAPGEQDTEMPDFGAGGPVQSPQATYNTGGPAESAPNEGTDSHTKSDQLTNQATNGTFNGLPHSDEPLTAPPTNSSPPKQASTADLPPQSESTFLNGSIDGTIRIWDRRMSAPIATIYQTPGNSPWCTGVCWSPDGNSFYAGRRNCMVDEYNIHKLSSSRGKPERVLKFQQGSGSVYAVKAMPNGRHLVCASQDILRIYDLSASESSRHRTVPFTIVPGHRGGIISSLYIDPACRFMLSASGNRGWESTISTEVLLGYEIGVQDGQGAWHK